MDTICDKLKFLAGVHRIEVRDLNDVSALRADMIVLLSAYMPNDQVLDFTDFEGDDFDGLFIQMESGFHLYIPL